MNQYRLFALQRPSSGREKISPSIPTDTDGFTLLEVLLVIVMVLILAAITYPSYMETVKKSRRSDAQSILLEASQFAERFFTDNKRYDQTQAGVAIALPDSLQQSPKQGTAKYYKLAITATVSAYTLTATPIEPGDRCGALSLNSLGVKSASDVDCW